MNHKAHSTIQKYNMITHGDTIVLGLSGGADSVALLLFLLSLKQEYNLKILAVHINHKLRGLESERDEEFVVYLCEKLQVSLKVACFEISKIAKKKSLSIEVCARECRYDYFNKIAVQYGAKIATGHTLSDSMETVFLNLIRGTGMAGICGIPPVRGNIIRPLIACTRKEIEAYCLCNNQNYVIDSSNLTDVYTRNKIRRHIIPHAYEINPNFEYAFLNFTQTIKEDQQYLMGKAREIFEEIVQQNICDIKQLLSLDLAIRNRVLALFLAKYSNQIDKRKIDLISSMLTKKNGCIQLGKNLFLKLDGEFLKIEVANSISTPSYFEHTLTHIKEQTIILNNKKLEIKAINNNINNFVNKNAFHLQQIHGKIVIRQKKDGDSIHLVHSNGTKKLKKLFNEFKIPLQQRQNLLVACDDLGVIWVEQFGVDKRVYSNERSQMVLCFQPSDL